MDSRDMTKKYRLNQWTEIIRECRNSGQTVRAWCLEHEVNPKSYYYWLRKVRAAACEALPAINEGSSSIVPFDVQTSGAMDSHHSCERTSYIILHIGSTTVEINNGASATLIETLLRAVKNAG